MTRRVKLAACQMGPVQSSASRPEVVGRLIHLLERAAKDGATLAVFPELALTTFFPRWEIDNETKLDVFYEASFPNAETQPLLDAARRLRIGFAIGFAEMVQDGAAKQRFNTMALVDAEGQVAGLYRKMHVPGSEMPEPGVTVHLERRYFAPGNLGFPVFDIDGLRVGLALCNDRRWPETYRMLCLNGAEIVLIGYNTPLLLDEAPQLAHLRMFHNHLPMQAGAYQNTVWVAAAAKAGLEDGQALIGGSCIIAPTGEITALATSLADEVVTYDADLGLIETCRRVNFDFARYRRPDQYRRICE
ncbi:N-carbamoyl-D-amino-acid hydrolase [Acidisoma cellulosilytica]|uniref:N-carbamoyl-D-amino-acid hydrolase n=1 Tax=Acidisoma cellulosilyticum TaxID=2802395 RepID=A0A963Z5S9_9PROT|nr:nitrilase-related carbon-nitrogen hydrolase [Acidisoma cellulosilyticum]MCB8883119.1 N-carbamoyl-D-amino-acid hydrolase [Acidisoma cellulosilyticum]